MDSLRRDMPALDRTRQRGCEWSDGLIPSVFASAAHAEAEAEAEAEAGK